MNKSPLLFFLLCILFTACTTNSNAKIEVTALTKTTKSWNDTPLPTYPDGTPEVTILKIVIPPKTKLNWHKHPVINAGVLLKGALTVISKANDTLHLKAGEPIVEIVNAWHYGENKGTEPAEIIVFYAGVEKKPITILETTH
ncbi:cupin domain protein [Kordia sp. SMS9]|uniref:cupin domain-containing protein n=1 Tax=Kordia sp. SMS9 TaxID=2282170 RepID=UPI000E0D2D23|nr:cupin domain-containing protein [Kordia sp. SMS9]AXG71685.1 cupin domain protein [Kordia sp. SMS9]